MKHNESQHLLRLRVVHESHPCSVDGVPVDHNACIWCASIRTAEEHATLTEQNRRLVGALTLVLSVTGTNPKSWTAEQVGWEKAARSLLVEIEGRAL